MDYILQRFIALALFMISLPFFLIVWLAIKLDDGGALFFKQKRAGKGKKSFLMYKFRTMVEGAEELKKKYFNLNEASGPVFKIKDDPRFTKVGRILAHTGIDELPQLINIVKGEMVLVGPRPLPVDEANKVPKKYKKRFSVLPGATSLWVVKGAHKLAFDEWMRLDLEYIDKRSFWLDLKVLYLTALLILKGLMLQFLKSNV